MIKGSAIRFKIEKLKNWIGIGIAIKNNIVGKNYQFLCTPYHYLKTTQWDMAAFCCPATGTRGPIPMCKTILLAQISTLFKVTSSKSKPIKLN